MVFLGLAIHSSFITKEEKAERQEEYDNDIELKRYQKDDDPDAGLTKEEKWERNRQIFMNLPKTPRTPYGGQGMPAMTPRTTAFTKLEGGEASAIGRPDAARTGSNWSSGSGGGGSGPTRPLAFREQYGDVAIPEPHAR